MLTVKEVRARAQSAAQAAHRKQYRGLERGLTPATKAPDAESLDAFQGLEGEEKALFLLEYQGALLSLARGFALTNEARPLDGTPLWTETLEGVIPTLKAMTSAQVDLRNVAAQASRAGTFVERNACFAAEVATHSAQLAAWSVGATHPEAVQRIYETFLNSTLAAGKAFSGAFDLRGAPLPDSETACQNAIREGEALAVVAVGTLLAQSEAAPMYTFGSNERRRAEAEKLIRDASVEDCGAIGAQILELSNVSLSREALARVILGEDNRLHAQLKGELVLGQGNHKPLTDPDRAVEFRALKLGLRLRQAMRLIAGLHLATRERREGVHKLYDVHLWETYDAEKANEGVRGEPDVGFARLALEVYVDCHALKNASTNPGATMDSAQR